MEKKYVGSGKLGKYDTVSVTIDLSKAEDFVYDYNNNKYLTIFVSPKKEVDQYGKSHSVYCLPKQERSEENREEKTQTATEKMESEAKVIEDDTDLPF